MAKASRSKKQPAFDPSELEDLIFSPVVGKGVGSHLIAVGRNMSTVDETTTVEKMAPAATSLSGEVPTGDVHDMATVVLTDMASVVGISAATVDTSRRRLNALWITRNGDLIGSRRVRRIADARDVINPGEQAVYDALWSVGVPDTARPDSRIAQAGYDYLGRQTGFAKKTIQRVIDKLLEKDFIVIERPADIYRRTSTVYRVLDFAAVLERHTQKGRTHVAKIGPGFSYVQPFSAETEMSTMDRHGMTTVDIQ